MLFCQVLLGLQLQISASMIWLLAQAYLALLIFSKHQLVDWFAKKKIKFLVYTVFVSGRCFIFCFYKVKHD
jgi:hypothetical protein